MLRLFCASPRPRLSTPGRRIADPRRSLQRPPTPPRFRGTHPRHIHSSHPPSAAPFACLRLRPGSLPFARPALRDPWEARSRSRSSLAALPYCCRTAHAHAHAHGDTDSPPVTAARLHELLPDTPSRPRNVPAVATAPATMVRRAFSTALAAAALAGTAYAGAKCSKDSHCPQDAPCCSRAYLCPSASSSSPR